MLKKMPADVKRLTEDKYQRILTNMWNTLRNPKMYTKKRNIWNILLHNVLLFTMLYSTVPNFVFY